MWLMICCMKLDSDYSGSVFCQIFRISYLFVRYICCVYVQFCMHTRRNHLCLGKHDIISYPTLSERKFVICLCNWRASCRRVFHTSRIKPTTYCNEFPIFVLRTMIVFWLIIFVCLLFALSELCVSTWFMIMSAFDWGCSLFDFQTWPHFTTDPRLRCSSRTRYSFDRCIYTITSGLRSEYFILFD